MRETGRGSLPPPELPWPPNSWSQEQGGRLLEVVPPG